MKKKELIKNILYCTRCCIPETQESIAFDKFGICNACQSSEQKMHIDWQAKGKELSKILETAKKTSGNQYDCVLPISGGKDSFFQAHILVKVYKVKPLAVTFNQHWISETGYYNLQRCLEVFDLDHIQFTPARTLVAKLAKKSLSAIGDACWHCHAGVGAFPMQVATRFNIPLLIWGESVSESSGRATFQCPGTKFSSEYLIKNSIKVQASQMQGEDLNEKDLTPFHLPKPEEIKKAGVWGLHLGDYIFWDEERQTEFIKNAYGWKETNIEGTYKRYKSAECIMAGVHDFTCYLKRGFGRSSMQASVDVRNGLLTRNEALQLISEYDPERPHALDYYLKITGFSEKEFYSVIKKQKIKILKNIKLKIKKNKRKHPEKLIPFSDQIILKHLKKM